MKRIIIVVGLILMSHVVNAQCVAEVKDVIQDEIRGSIIVQSEYTLNGKVVQQGQARYLETSGTNAEIIARAKEDIDVHCKNLVRRIEANRDYLISEKLKRQKELTAPVITDIKPSLVGYKTTTTEAINTFKEREIKVTYDQKNTVNTVIAVEPEQDRRGL